MRRPVILIIALIAAVALLIGAVAALIHVVTPSAHLDLQSRVTRSISEEIVRINVSQGDRLEVASVETRETFREDDSLKAGWLDLGTTTASVSVPVVYRFHIALADGIRADVTVHGDMRRCVVHAPLLRPTLPPAIRTEGMRKESKNGWARFNAGENLEALEKNLTAELILRAPGKAVLARDKAREAVAGFVSRWLVRDNLWGGPDGVREIVVLFPDEKETPLTQPVLRHD